jgi:hypothetical protein
MEVRGRSSIVCYRRGAHLMNFMIDATQYSFSHNVLFVSQFCQQQLPHAVCQGMLHAMLHVWPGTS